MTHNITTTIHTANQQQLHTRQLKTINNTHETNYNFTTCTKGKNTPATQHWVQFIVIGFSFSESLTRSRFHLSLFTSHHVVQDVNKLGGVRLLCIRWWSFGFRKGWRTSPQSEWLLAFQKAVCCVVLVGWLVILGCLLEQSAMTSIVNIAGWVALWSGLTL